MLKRSMLASAMAVIAMMPMQAQAESTTCTSVGYGTTYCETTSFQEDVFYCNRRKQKWLAQCTIGWLRLGCPEHREFNRPSHLPAFTPMC